MTEIFITDQFVSSIPSTEHSFCLKTTGEDSSPPNHAVVFFFKATIDFTKHKFWTASSKPEWSGHQKHSRSRDIPEKTKQSVYEVITPQTFLSHLIFSNCPQE